MRLLKHILFVLSLSLVAAPSWAQTESEIRKKADELFEIEAYVEATPLFLQLLNLYPTDPELNFKYGTCSLFNDDKQKQDAIKFLTAAVQNETIDPRAFYFRGKALHWNYQFDEAKKSYTIYKNKRAAKDQRYDVDRDIEMCENGKKLMLTFTDIIVSEKKQVDDDKFFRLYTDMNSIGGDILVTERFQSKLDKKKGHIPIVHYPKNAQAVYYSSYGDDDKNGLDIYVRKKLPDGSWGDPYRLLGEVNTEYDENFPYLHPNGRYLYFSSKGHNSMGGYDVFMARLNPETNQFERTENVDFAICSPDDDLFYVVDSAYQNAYFASARQSEQGKYHVYKVRVVRVPVQEVIVMGDFASTINPDNKAMTILVTSENTGSEVGKIVSNKTGKYSFVFPKGGKYKLDITIDGIAQTFTKTIDLPFLDEFKPLKQKIVHEMVNGNEVVRIIDLFGESVEGGEELIAKVLKEKANLDVNIDEFDPNDLAKIELEARQADLLRELGFEGMSIREVQNQLSELAADDNNKAKEVQQLNAGIGQDILEKSKEIDELTRERDELIREASSESDPVKQHALLTEAKQKDAELTNRVNGVNGLVDLKNEVERKFGDGTTKESQMAIVESKFNSLVSQGKEDEALTYLASQKEAIFEAKNVSTEGLIKNLVDETIELRKRQEQLADKNSENRREIESVEADIQALESKLPGAKKKEADQLNKEITQLKESLAIFEREVKYNKEDIAGIDNKLAVLDSKINVLQNAGTSNPSSVAGNLVNDAVADVNSQEKASKAEQISESLAKIERENPSLFTDGGDPIVTTTNDKPLTQNEVLTAIDPDYTAEIKRVSGNQTLSELDRLKALQSIDENFAEKAEDRLRELQSKLESDPTNLKAIEELGIVNDVLYETNQTMEEREDKINRIENQTPEIAISKDDIIAQISPNYTAEIERITANQTLSEVDQLKALNTEDKRLETTIEKRLGKIESLLEMTPTDSELLGEKEVLTEVLAETKAAVSSRTNQISALETTTATPLTVAQTIEKVNPNYANEVASIEANDDLSVLQKLDAQQKVDEELIASLRAEQAEISNAVKSNPADQELKAREESVKNAIAQIDGQMDERIQSINALNNVSSVVDVEATKQAIESEVKGDYAARKEEIDQSSGSEVQRNLDRLKLEQDMMTVMTRKRTEIQAEVNADPTNAQKQAELGAINELIVEQSKMIDNQRNETLAASLLAEVYTRTVAGADRKYSVEIGDLMRDENPNQTKIAEREVELQERIQTDLEKREKAILRNYTVEADLELMILQNELRESKAREETAKNGSTVANASTKESDFVSKLRQEFLRESGLSLDNTSPSLEELRQHDERLNTYQLELEIRRNATQEKMEADPENTSLPNELTWVDAEWEKVAAERRGVQISIGELESSTVAVQNSTASDPRIAKLENDRAEILRELNDPNLSTAERKELETSLAEISEATTIINNEVKTNEISVAQQTQDNLKNALQQLGTESETETVTAALTASEEERKAIDALLVKSDQAKTEEERSFLLTQAQARQDNLNENLQRVVENQEVINIEEEAGITILSRAELEKRRRDFIIDIGELEVKQGRVEEQLSTAKRNEVPALTKEKEGIESQFSLLRKQLAQIESRLETMDVEEPVDRIAKAGLGQDVSFNEERKIAASENYKDYQVEGVKALEIENQMRIFQQDLDNERADLLTLLTEPKSEQRDLKIELKTRKIKELESTIQALNKDFNEQMEVANRLLPSDKEEAMKIQNLLARGVQPLKTAVVATALIQMPTTGFAIDTSGESIYSASNPIPVDVKNPTGLTYRVQVGAFAKPIPQDLFKEFNPVSGEKIENTNVVRYMAGFFNNSDSVINAREAIRGLGYSDAFVVAYCDGERISFGEARRRELAGECVPKGRNELALEVAQNTAVHMGIPLINEVVDVPEFAYNQAPGAVKATPIELKQGLFFTVQVGVFNRPVADSEIKNLPEVMTVRLPNGLIRYSSGMFNSVEEALPRRTDAQTRGISDAFVVAYYKGERITIARANQLLEENGTSILQSSIEKVVPVEVVETIPANQQATTVTTQVVEAPIVAAKDEQRIQIVTKKTFEEYPRDVLNRYNTEGNFYFDESDGKVKSEIYTTKNSIPRLYKFEKDIDTLYLSLDEVELELEKKHVSVKLSSDKVPGDLADWLLRMGYQKKFVRVNNELELHIEGIEPNRLQDVQYRIREVGLEPILVERLEEVEE